METPSNPLIETVDIALLAELAHQHDAALVVDNCMCTPVLQQPAGLGADVVINYETQDFTAIERQFDLVFDAVGKTSFFECRKLLKPDGIYSATDLGPWWSNIWLGLWFGITGSRRVRVPYPDDAPGFMRRLSVLMEKGQYRGVFDRRFPMADVAAAFRYVELGQKTGIVVLEIGQR